MGYGDTITEVEEGTDNGVLHFHVEYNIPEELDEDGEGDWGHSASFLVKVMKKDIRMVDGELFIDKLKGFQVVDGVFSNSKTGESSGENTGDFTKTEILKIILETLSEESLCYLKGDI